MPRRTQKDLLALVNANTSNSEIEAGTEVYIRRDEDEAYGQKYDEEGPESAKAYNYRANRLSRHGWVEEVRTSDVAPSTRAVGELTETGAKILKAAYDESDEWEAWNDHELGTGEFVDSVTEESGDETDEDSDDFEHGEPVEVGGVDEFKALPGSTHEDKIAYHDGDYPSNTHGLEYP